MTKSDGAHMFRQILVAGLVGGVIVFVLSAFQNTVLPAGAPKAMPEQAAILPTLRTSIPQAGFYFFPGSGLSRTMTKEQKETTQADYRRRFREGPTGVIAYSPGGDEFQFGRQLAFQCLLSLAAALTVAAILGVMVPTASYGARVGVVFLMGVFAFANLEPQYWNWYGFPASYTIARVGGGIATWTIAGLAMSAIVR